MTTPFPRPRLTQGTQLQPHERRGLTRYKLAKWDARTLCFRDGKAAFDTAAEAMSAARAAGRYRISTITDSGRTDGEPFARQVVTVAPEKVVAS